VADKKGGGTKKAEFFAIKDGGMVSRILGVAHHHKIPITIWTKNQAIKFESHVMNYLKDMGRIYVKLHAEIQPARFDLAIKEGNHEILGSFQIDSTNFFFRTTFIQRTSTTTLQLHAPLEIYKLQRRANLRIPFSRKFAPKLTAFDPGKEYDSSKAISEKDIVPFRMLDVSAGGLAIAVALEDEAKFPQGKKIYDMRFSLRKAGVIANGVVRHTAKIKNELGKPILKIGISFVGIKMQYEQIIVQFVLEESRRLFSLLH
jgi:c-di-GMP-binding flagellar brake protein YcgR